jgi:hypothetical protein
MEVTAAVTAKNLKLAVDSLDGVGGGKSTSDAVRVAEEEEIVRPLFT